MTTLKKLRSYKRNYYFLKKNNRGLRFYLGQRKFQFFRLITTTSALPSIFLGLIAIILAIYGNFISNTKPSENLKVLYFGLGILIILITVIYLSRVFFKKQTPKQYADFSIQGREHSKSIRYISYSIWKMLSYYEHQYKGLYKSIKELKVNKGVIPNNPDFVKKISSLRKDISKNSIILDQICDMMGILANSMNVPSFRISDFLFQFSPEIFNYEMKLCLKRLEEIGAYQNESSTSGDIEKRAIKIIKSLDSFYLRISYQRDLFTYTDLHSNIIDISMGMGLTSSLTAYALGLKKIGENKNNTYDKNSIMRRLIFLYHKRRMFPGFDIHCLLINLISKNISIPIDKKAETIDALKLLSNNYRKNQEDKNEDENELYGDIVSKIKGIVFDVNQHISKQRQEIIKNFQDFMISELKFVSNKRKEGKLRKLIFITQGYSSVVNSTLYNTFINYKIKENASETNQVKESHNLKVKEIIDQLNYNLDLEGEITEKKIEVYIYVLKPKDENESFTSTRYVRYQFKENPNLKNDIKTSINLNVKIGDEEWLKNRFYKKDECLCYLLSGAEFFQIEKKQTKNKTNYQLYRMINTEEVNNLTNIGFDETYMKQIVLAENYKKFSRPINEPMAKESLNRENLEYLQIYEWSPHRIIISDKKYQNTRIALEAIKKEKKESKEDFKIYKAINIANNGKN